MTLSTVRCQVLGKAEIHTRGIRLTPESELQFGLAMYFCGSAGRDVPRDDVARLFWPQHGIEAARHNLRQSLYRLRVLGVPVRSGAKSSVLDTHFVEADFSPVVAEGAPASVYLRMADVAVLPGYSPRFSRAFARWVETFREDVGTRIRRGLVRAISEMRARGRYADVERLCRHCLVLDPLNEEATLALAEAVALAGGKVEAVGMIDRYAGEVARYGSEMRLPASLLRERISDRLIRRSQAAMELPMVGREEDVERVLAAFQRLRGNRAVSYIINGAAGVGKTRLASECCRIAELQGARVLTIGTQPSSRTQALFVVSELVDGMLQLPGAIGCAPSALECLRAMSAPLSVREPALSLDTDGEARFAMVRWSILDVVDAILSEGPLLIHVDDAHQLDAQSQLILQDALRTHAERPLLLLLSMRDPEVEDGERFARVRAVSTVHDLSPLSDESCDRLVSRFCAVHEEELDAHTRERIIQLSGGNPLFLLELLKHRSQLVTDDLPVSVQALLEERLLRLSPTALTVLRAAAVLGLSSNVDRLQRLVERKTSDVLGALTELHAAGMLSAHDSGTMCRHDTIRDAVLERTPTAARRLLHRRAAKVLGREVLREGGVAELWDCLHHWRQAGMGAKGIPLALAVTKRLLRFGLLDDAFTVLDEVVATTDRPEYRLAARKRRVVAAALARHWERVREEWALLKGDLAISGHALKEHSSLELLVLEAEQFREDGYSALAAGVLECIRSSSASVTHRLAAATLVMILADNDGDVALGHSVISAIEGVKCATLPQRLSRATVDMVFNASFGDVRAAVDTARFLINHAQSVRHPARKALLLRRAACALRLGGEHVQAREALTEALRVTEALRLHRHSFTALECLVLLCTDAGSYDEATEWLTGLRSVEAENPSPFTAATRYANEIRLAYAIGDLTLVTSNLPSAQDYQRGSIKRPAQHLLAALCAKALLEDDRESLKKMIPELKAGHEHAKARGLYDFEVAVLVDALTAEGRASQARDVLVDYFRTSRRDLMPIPPYLQRTARSLEE